MSLSAVLLLSTATSATIAVAATVAWYRCRRRERAYHDLELQIEARTRALNEASRELEAFSYSVSHDLRAPLRHVRGYATALAEDCSEGLGAEGRDYLQRLQRAATRMDQLISDLLELSHLSRTDLQREEVDLSAMAREIGDELIAADMAARPAHMEIEAGLRAMGDPGLLRIVVQNLLSNALKYTARAPCARIRVYSGVDGGVRYFCVEDNGVGFDMAHVDRLFGPFQRLHAADEFPGHGIGLATVARIIHRHEGLVWARGTVGEGAAFHFTLPE